MPAGEVRTGNRTQAYVQLVHNYRVDGKLRERVLLSLWAWRTGWTGRRSATMLALRDLTEKVEVLGSICPQPAPKASTLALALSKLGHAARGPTDGAYTGMKAGEFSGHPPEFWENQEEEAARACDDQCTPA